MFEKLQHNVSQEHEEPAITTSSGRSIEGLRLKRKDTERQNNERFTLMELIAIFTDEAEKICKDKTIANLIALESLRDYIKKNVSNIEIVL